MSDEDFLNRVKNIYQSLSPAASYSEVAKRLEKELPPSNNPLVPTGHPFITDAKQLADPKVLEEFSAIVETIITWDNKEEAVNAISLLEETLFPLYPSLAVEKPGIYRQYQNLLVLLKFVALDVQSLPVIESLILEHLQQALQKGIYLHQKFQDVLDTYNDILMEGKIAEKLATALLRSKSRIGQQELQVGRENHAVPPTVASWLLDYHSLVGADKGGAVEQITYLNQSQNIRQLSQFDQKLVLGVIKLYDWLRFGGPAEESQKQEVEAPKIPTVSAPVGKVSPGNVPLPSKPPVIPPGVLQKPLTIAELKKEVAESHVARLPAGQAGNTDHVTRPIAEEIKREVETKELPEHVSRLHQDYGGQARITQHVTEPVTLKEIASSSWPNSMPPRNDERSGLPVMPSVPSRATEDRVAILPKEKIASSPVKQMDKLNEIKFLDDLKKVDLKYLRRGDLKTQIVNLKSRIAYLAGANHLFPYEVVAMFEQSPLFKAYLAHGSAKVQGSAAVGDLSQAEFESIADLKRELERL